MLELHEKTFKDEKRVPITLEKKKRWKERIIFSWVSRKKEQNVAKNSFLKVLEWNRMDISLNEYLKSGTHSCYQECVLSQECILNPKCMLNHLERTERFFWFDHLNSPPFPRPTSLMREGRFSLKEIVVMYHIAATRFSVRSEPLIMKGGVQRGNS